MDLWIVFAILSAVFASLVAVFGKIGISGIDSTLATTVRAVIMATFLIATSLLMGKAHLLSTLNNKVLAFIILSGVSGAISWLFYFMALKIGPATGVAALDRMSVVFVLIFASLFLGEALTIKTAIGGLLITIGAILLTIK